MPRRPASPRSAVRAELSIALFDLLLTPFRALAAAFRHSRDVAEVAALLEREEAVDLAPDVAIPRDRALVVLVSCAEVSGEIHAANAVRALRSRVERSGAPSPRFVGLGGAHLRAAGVETSADPVSAARMGLGGVIGALPYYLDLLRGVAASCESAPPDVVFAVDSPALHVPLGRIARRYGVPVVHFVTPQYWGWAAWRVRRYPSAVDAALSILPFEKAWFARRGVSVRHVGHPLLDELAPRPASTSDDGSLVLLAGSRRGVIERNLPWMLEVAAPLARSGVARSVVVVHERAELAPLLHEHVERAGATEWARVETGDLSAVLARARAALSVSGTVLLDLMHARVPAVVVYRLGARIEPWLARHLLTAPWFASVNLLAAREVYPEHCFAGRGPLERVRADVERALSDDAWRERCRAGLAEAERRLGPRGACDRAAAHALELACRPRGARVA